MGHKNLVDVICLDLKICILDGSFNEWKIIYLLKVK